jgi:hypothetical protein
MFRTAEKRDRELDVARELRNWDAALRAEESLRKTAVAPD